MWCGIRIFPADEVEREKKKALDRLAQAENDPSSIARRVAPMLAFGRNHPYGHPVNGFRASLAKITPARTDALSRDLLEAG